MKSKTIVFTFCCIFALRAMGEEHGEYPNDPPRTPQEEQKLLHLPPGFEAQLVAAEPDIQKPVNINFDAQGRLWTTGSELYPWPAAKDATGKPIENFEKAYQAIADAFTKGEKPESAPEGRDCVRVLSDFDANGHAQKIQIFADKLNIPSGIVPLPRAPGAKGDTIIVYSLPYIWRMEDTTGDGKADKREILFGPLTFVDTHGGSSNYTQGVDGWIYGTHGFRNESEIKNKDGTVVVLHSGNTYRFKADGSAFEIYSHGQTNPFGLAFSPTGDVFTSDSHSKPVYLVQHGGFYEGIGKNHDGLGFAPRVTDDDHGSSAIAGIVYYDATQFPKEYWGNTFNGNVATLRINRDAFDWKGSTPNAVRQADFLHSDDHWFRPVNLKLGPDGALWVADFYNAIIGHYEVPLTDPHRDHAHGRIWRIVYRGESKAPVPLPENLSKLDTQALVNKLDDPNIEVRRLVVNELVEHVGKSAIPALKAVVTPTNAKALAASPAGKAVTYEWKGSSLARYGALWALERLGALEPAILAYNTADPGPAPKAGSDEKVPHLFAQIAALRIAAERSGAPVDPKFPETIAHLATLLAAPNAEQARAGEYARAVMEAVVWKPSADYIAPICVAMNAISGEDRQLVYASRIALRDCFATPGGLAAARKLAGDQNAQNRIADVALAVKTPESAEFLLGYLDQNHLKSDRTTEYLLHIGRNIAPDRINELATLVKKYPDAGPQVRLAAADALAEAGRVRGITFSPETKAWFKTAMIEALASYDEAILKRAIEAVRDENDPTKIEPLAKIAATPNDSRNETLRIAALEALSNMPQAAPYVQKALSDASSINLRKRAASLLGQLNTDEARDVLIAALPTAPSDLAVAIATALVQSDAGAEKLLALVESGKASASLLRSNAVSGPLNARPQALKDRATAATKDLPPEDARLEKVITERADAYQKAKPNAEHGNQVFQANCAACHKIHNVGGNIGPNLDGIGSRGVHRVIEDILDPNRNVDPTFRQVIIETKDGRTLAGAGLHEKGKLLVLNDMTGKELSVAKTDVKSQTASKLSLMPPIFEQSIPPDDLNDLVAFLIAQSPVAK